MTDSVKVKRQISKVHSEARKGYKRGSTSAAWQKLKSATKNGASTHYSSSDAQFSLETDDDYVNAECSSETHTETTSRGDIVILFSDISIVEIWSWFNDESSYSSGDTMYLSGRYNLLLRQPSDTKFICFKVISDDKFGIKICALRMCNGSDAGKGGIFIDIFILNNTKKCQAMQSIALPNVMQDRNLHFKIKATDKYLIASASNGLVYVLKYDPEISSFRPANYDSKLESIQKSMRIMLGSKYPQLDSSGDELIFLTSCANNAAIFDVVGNWFVYSPTKSEHEHLNLIKNTNEKLVKSVAADDLNPLEPDLCSKRQRSPGIFLSPVTLPPSGPLLNKVIWNLSNTAAEGFYKFSEASSLKIKNYIRNYNQKKGSSDSNESSLEYVIQSFNSLGKSISKSLYSTASSTASSIQKKTRSNQSESNQLVKVVDLSNDSVVTIFKPPQGISKISLSPFDLQMVHVNLRGDSIYMWDLYKASRQVSLLGRFIRGKTSGVTDEIFWFINNYDSTSAIKGNNSGFGCITRKTGTVHWFNINYLSGDHLHNHPNNLIKDYSEDVSQNLKNNFLDSWVLSSMNAKKFLGLPNISNTTEHNSIANPALINQLAILDADNKVKLISPLNGVQVFKYDLPTTTEKPGTLYCFDQSRPAKHVKDEENSCYRFSDPLAQTEIETCCPYLNFINNDNVEFATYDFGNSTSPFDILVSLYKVPGEHIKFKEIKLKENPESRKCNQAALSTDDAASVALLSPMISLEN